MANKVAFVLLAIAACTVSANPWAAPPPPCAQELVSIPEPACGAGGPGPDGLVLGAGGVDGAGVLTPGDLAPAEANQAPTVRRLRTITIPGRRNHIIEHHSRPIWIRSAITRFVVPSAPVIVKPVLIHKPSSVSVRPNVISQGGQQTVPAPILLRIVKQIEQPATQRTLILERPVASSSCRIEAATSLGGISIGAGGAAGAAGLAGGLGGLGGLAGLGGAGCGGSTGCGQPLCNICG